MTTTSSQKISPARLSGIEKWVPGILTIRTYQRPWLSRDLVAAVLLTAEPITDVDTTATDMLVELAGELNADGIHLVFAELKNSVRDIIEHYCLFEIIDRHHLYPTIDEAVEAFHQQVSIDTEKPL